MIRLCLPFDENTAGLTGYVRDAVLYMASHYGESTINVAKIAGAVGISEGHLSHCFKKETGYTVMGWLTRYRMKKAVELLSDHRNKVYEVAEKVGYKDIAYFSNTFKNCGCCSIGDTGKIIWILKKQAVGGHQWKKVRIKIKI